MALWFHGRWPDVPVLVVSASPEHLEQAARDSPFVTCLFKTSAAHELLATIESACEMNRS